MRRSKAQNVGNALGYLNSILNFWWHWWQKSSPGPQNVAHLKISKCLRHFHFDIRFEKTAEVIPDKAISMLMTSVMTSWWDFDHCSLYSCSEAPDFKISFFYAERRSIAKILLLVMVIISHSAKISFCFRSYFDINMAAIFFKFKNVKYSSNLTLDSWSTPPSTFRRNLKVCSFHCMLFEFW